MAIYRLLKKSTLGPEEISRIIAAYEQALDTLCVKDRDDRLTEIIAKKIIKIAQTGDHDVAQLSAQAIYRTGRPVRPASVGGLFRFECRLVALDGHAAAVARRPLLGVRPTSGS